MNTAKPLFREYYEGFLFVGTVQRRFKFAIDGDRHRQTNQPVQNLMSNGETLLIKTTWQLPFKTNMAVEIDGELYKINSCVKVKTQLNEQANRLWKPHNIFWQLELIR